VTRFAFPRPPANLVWFDEVDSTNELASRIMAAWLGDEEEPLPDTVLVAAAQSGGRGRGSNAWQSPLGGLYATWLAWMPMEKLTLVPLAAGVALAEAVEVLLPHVQVGLKWPNDLQVQGRKLGGVLCQSRGRGGLAWVMVGFGINVGEDPVLPPGDPVRPTSLHSLGLGGEVEKSIWTVLSAFLVRIHRLLDAPDAAGAAWVARSVHRPGEWMRLRLPAGVVEGRFIRLVEDGRLELDMSGEVRQFASGELIPNAADLGG
jgi:BirA family biotin operon repressor/biotin-[acetyl-CoA-carboxylase] ligase